MPDNHAKCPSCGNDIRNSELRCKFSGYEPNNREQGDVSRLSDAELVQSMDAYQKNSKRILVASVFVLAAALFSVQLTGEEFSAYTAMGIGLSAVFMVLIGLSIRSFTIATEMFKVNVVYDVLADFIEDCIYEPKESMSRAQIARTELVDGWSEFSGEDYVHGTYKGHFIEFSDIHLRKKVGGKGKRNVVTVFKGHWLIFNLARTLPATIRLSGAGGESNAETENIAFNSKYSIYADDPYNMFHVLTPHFMDCITAAEEVANARIYFHFEGNAVHIAVDSRRNFFEISSSDRNDPVVARERIKRQMGYITNILDELLQNETLFL